MGLVRFTDLIEKKRHGYRLTAEDIDFFIRELLDKNVSDAQLGAFLMAMFIRVGTSSLFIGVAQKQ